MESKKTRHAWTRVLYVVGLLSITPLAFSPSQGLEENLACGVGDQCVQETSSVCMGDGMVLYNHYLRRVIDLDP